MQLPHNALTAAYPTVDTHSAAAVAAALSELHAGLYPEATLERSRITIQCEALELLFHGGFPGFQPVDTPYHDLEHTLQVALCLGRLLATAHKNGGPTISAEAFERALVAAFFHDVGYFKILDDNTGTGAKYTAHHELRGALMAATYLPTQDWEFSRVTSVQRLILATAAERAVRAITFQDPLETFLGACLCTADLLAQMSDPRYLDRLPLLYQEFEEADLFSDTPPERRLLKSKEDLFAKTPFFWHEALNKRLILDCNSVYRYLELPYGSGHNPYIQAIEAHLMVLAKPLFLP